MDRSDVLAMYEPEELDRVIHICDNLFYNNYLVKGKLEAREEIHARIKKEVEKSFIDFWGEKHAEKIKDKIENTEMRFIYQIQGSVNSINECLEILKTQRFQKFSKLKVKDPIWFSVLCSWLEKEDNDLKAFINNPSLNLVLKKCLNQLGITKEQIINDEKLAKSTVQQIRNLGKQYDEVTYSNNPEVNANLKFLESFCQKFYAKTTNLCEKYNYDVYQTIFKNKGLFLDPIVQLLDPQQDAWDMLRNHTIKGLHCNKRHLIYFGIYPNDSTILHEFIHELENGGLEKGHTVHGILPYTNKFRCYEMLNEVVTDYFASLMCQRRTITNQPEIVSKQITMSAYSDLFVVMNKFLTYYLPELKEIILRQFPTEEFKRIIGERLYEKLAAMCSLKIALNHDKDLHEMAQKQGVSLNNILAQHNETLYGDDSSTLSIIFENTKYVDKHMKKTLCKINRLQPIDKKIKLSAVNFGLDVAQKLRETQNPKLYRLSRTFYGLAKQVEAKTTEQAVAKLKPEFEEFILYGL